MLQFVLAWALAQVPEPPTPVDDIRWAAPMGCPGRAELIAGVERRRGQALVPGQVRVDATVTAGPARRFTLELWFAAGAREERRTLTADRCAALVDAAALLLAVAIDEMAAQAPEPAPPEPAPSEHVPIEATVPLVEAPAPVVEEAASPPIVPERAPATAPRSRVGGFVRPQGGLVLGAVPGATGAVGLGLGVLWRRARLELQPMFVAPRTAVKEGREVRAFLVAVAALGCYRVGRGALEVPLCGGLEGGVMHGAASGPDGVSAVGGWFAALASAGAVWRVHPRVGLWTGVQGSASVWRPSFVLRGPGQEVLLFAPEPVTLRVLGGLELRFGDPR